MKKEIKWKVISTDKMKQIKGGSLAQCIIDAHEAGLNPMRFCCPGCNIPI